MKTLLVLMALAQGADIGTSIGAFHLGAREQNPLIISTQPAPFIAQTVAMDAAKMLLLQKLSHAHPKLAKGLSYLQIGASSAAATNNAVWIHRLNQR